MTSPQFNRKMWVAFGPAFAIVICWSFFGAPLWVSAAAAGLPWLAILGRRYGWRMASGFMVVSTLWLVVLSLTLSAALSLQIGPTFVLIFAVAGVVGYIAVLRGRHWGVGEYGHPAPWLAAAAGAVIWTTAQALSGILPAHERLAWVMRNDSLANLLFARQTIYANGIEIGVLENPAPLPAAVVALTALPGRSIVPADLLLEHDLEAMSLVWGFLIATTCVLAGLVAASLVRCVRSGSVFWETGAALVSSLSVLSWYFTGYPMEYGFLNTHVALVVLLSAILIYFNTDIAPWLATVGMALATTLVLAVWSPLAVIPIALLVAGLLTNWRAHFSSRGLPMFALVFAVAQLVAYGLLISLPIFLAQRAALTATGGIFNPGSWVVFVSGALVLMAGAATVRKIDRRAIGIAALVGAPWAGLGLLLFLGRSSADPWTYYPIKFAWLSSLIFILVLTGLVLGMAARYLRSRTLRALAITVLAGLLSLLVTFAPSVPPFVAMNPVDRLLRSHLVEELPKVNKLVFEFANPDHPVVLWQYAEWGEGEVNLWLMQLWADSLTENTELRLLSYSTYYERPAAPLCTVGELMGSDLTVFTSNPGLEQEVHGFCPTTTMSFVVAEPRPH